MCVVCSQADGLDKQMSLSPEDIYLTLLPLREWALELLQDNGGRRIVIGMAGPGAAGKVRSTEGVLQ